MARPATSRTCGASWAVTPRALASWWARSSGRRPACWSTVESATPRPSTTPLAPPTTPTPTATPRLPPTTPPAAYADYAADFAADYAADCATADDCDTVDDSAHAATDYAAADVSASAAADYVATGDPTPPLSASRTGPMLSRIAFGAPLRSATRLPHTVGHPPSYLWAVFRHRRAIRHRLGCTHHGALTHSYLSVSSHSVALWASTWLRALPEHPHRALSPRTSAST